MDQFIAYGDEFLDKDKIDGIHKNIKVTTTNYLENTLAIIKFWRVFYYNKLREQIDTKSWLKHGEVSVVNAFYSLDGNNIEFPGKLNHRQYFQMYQVESLFLGFLKEDLFYFYLNNFSKIFIFSFFIILPCYS